MSKSLRKLIEIHTTESTLNEQSWLYMRHPAAHVMVLLAYLLVVASLGKYEVMALIPFLILPIWIIYSLEIPVAHIGKRLLVIEPFILIVALLNPLIERDMVSFGNYQIALGWLTFLSIMIKSLFTLTMALEMGILLGIEGLCTGLTTLGAPSAFVQVIGLTFRYLGVLAEETLTLTRAYKMRAPGHRGVHHSAWGSFAGQMILRSYDRAERVNRAMRMRGYNNKALKANRGLDLKDYQYIIGVVIYLALFRALPLLG